MNTECKGLEVETCLRLSEGAGGTRSREGTGQMSGKGLRFHCLEWEPQQGSKQRGHVVCCRLPCFSDGGVESRLRAGIKGAGRTAMSQDKRAVTWLLGGDAWARNWAERPSEVINIRAVWGERYSVGPG